MTLLSDGLEQLSITYDEKHLLLFEKYINALVSVPHNLTAIKTKDEIVTNHFLDSLAGLPFLPDEKDLHICDVGSGAGFPLLPLKIIRPDLDCTFIDSRTKSTDFIRQLASEMGLERISTIHVHTSQLKKHPLKPFDVIVTRAFADVKTTLEETLFLLRPKGILLLYKGPKIFEELDSVSHEISKKVIIRNPVEIKVPFLDKTRYILEIMKK